jgi:hydroxymethylglutaryl-CoA reductase (NADPH)
MAKKEEILRKVVKRELKLHQIENLTENIQEAVEIRRMFAEQISGASLKHLSSTHWTSIGHEKEY